MKTIKEIKFKNRKYLLIGDLENGGAIATKQQYKNGRCSFAHLMENGEVMRFGEKIGTIKDIKIIGNCEIEIGWNAICGLLIDPSWPMNKF